jgi:hypothetical protein
MATAAAARSNRRRFTSRLFGGDEEVSCRAVIGNVCYKPAMVDDRTLGRAMAWNRIVVGTTMIIAPRIAGRVLHGTNNGSGNAALMRSVGLRDVGIGIGLLSSIRRDWDIAPWALFASAADLTDTAARLLAHRDVPPGRRAVAAGFSALAFGVDFFRVGRIEGRTNPYPELA